jgi:hypothetical protein
MSKKRLFYNEMIKFHDFTLTICLLLFLNKKHKCNLRIMTYQNNYNMNIALYHRNFMANQIMLQMQFCDCSKNNPIFEVGSKLFNESVIAYDSRCNDPSE